MAVRIRLRRIGKKKQPQYRLVAAEAAHPRDGRFIEVLGHYNPRVDPPAVSVKAERALYWLQHGAQPTDTAKSLLVRTGVWEQFTGEPMPAPPPAREAAVEAPVAAAAEVAEEAAVEAAPEVAEDAAAEAAPEVAEEAAAEPAPEVPEDAPVEAGDEGAPEPEASAEPETAGAPEEEEEPEAPAAEAGSGTEAQAEGRDEETQQG